MLDRELVERHIQNMEVALQNLSRYQGLSLDALRKDLSLVWIAEKGLQILIQNLLDIGAHILASEIHNDWEEYGDIIEKLGRHGVLPEEFAQRIHGMAGLRNVLVHEYIRIELPRIHGYLGSRLEDFVEFMAYVRRYLAART